MRQEEFKMERENLVKEGDHVSDGQELFIYDTTEEEQDLAQAEIDLERLQNSHDTSEAEIVELTEQMQQCIPDTRAEISFNYHEGINRKG